MICVILSSFVLFLFKTGYYYIYYCKIFTLKLNIKLTAIIICSYVEKYAISTFINSAMICVILSSFVLNLFITGYLKHINFLKISIQKLLIKSAVIFNCSYLKNMPYRYLFTICNDMCHFIQFCIFFKTGC